MSMGEGTRPSISRGSRPVRSIALRTASSHRLYATGSLQLAPQDLARWQRGYLHLGGGVARCIPREDDVGLDGRDDFPSVGRTRATGLLRGSRITGGTGKAG